MNRCYNGQWLSCEEVNETPTYSVMHRKSFDARAAFARPIGRNNDLSRVVKRVLRPKSHACAQLVSRKTVNLAGKCTRASRNGHQCDEMGATQRGGNASRQSIHG